MSQYRVCGRAKEKRQRGSKDKCDRELMKKEHRNVWIKCGKQLTKKDSCRHKGRADEKGQLWKNDIMNGCMD